ncbi:MAG: hypothetical protein Q4E13_00600 [Clostridia bacterium]|nr:hypothetical protein [Clostridia bacterium]
MAFNRFSPFYYYGKRVSQDGLLNWVQMFAGRKNFHSGHLIFRGIPDDRLLCFENTGVFEACRRQLPFRGELSPYRIHIYFPTYAGLFNRIQQKRREGRFCPRTFLSNDRMQAVPALGLGAARKITDGKIVCKGLCTLGGENSGAYTAHAPASFFSIGAGDIGPVYGNCFCPEEFVFEVGAALLALFAINALNDVSKEA